MGITCLDPPQSGFSSAQINCTKDVSSLLPTDAVEINSKSLPRSRQIIDRPGLKFRDQMQSANLSNSTLGAGVIDLGYSVRHFGPIVAFHDNFECPRGALVKYFLVSPLNDLGLQMHRHKNPRFSTASFFKHV